MSDALQAAYDAGARRAAWHAFMGRLIAAFADAKDACDGQGVIDADRLIDIGDDATQVEALGKLSSRHLIEMFRHAASRVGDITEQVFPGAPTPEAVRIWAEDMSVAGLVALVRYNKNEYAARYQSYETLVLTSDDSTTVAAALMFLGTDS